MSKCVENNICGNGIIETHTIAESCDDGNKTPGDGCDSFCQIETGFYCPIED